jgi:hypothetical protein
MSRFRQSFLLTLAFLFGAGSVLAGNIAVGTCKPKLQSFSTISEAVAAAPAGSTVMVCPGTYPEQVTISQSLTLEGISDGNSDQVVIAVPSGGVSLNATDQFGFPLAAQVFVVVGPVNITNITVDGAGNNLNGAIGLTLAGIFYGSGSSGIVKQVTTRNQIDFGNGRGIWIDNGNSTSESVTIENCSIHDFDNSGIFLFGNLTATVRANNVYANNAAAFSPDGIFVDSAGSITGNTFTGPGSRHDSAGARVFTSSATLSDNVFINWSVAMDDSAGATYTNNTIQNANEAFEFSSAGVTVNSNTITQAVIAIEFFCQTGTVTVAHNTINDAGSAFNGVPASSSLSSPNNYFNVASIRGDGCSDAASQSLSKGARTQKAAPLAQ